MDGFAVGYEDSHQAPITLKITQSIQAQGLTNLPTIKKGEARSITTGFQSPKVLMPLFQSRNAKSMEMKSP